MFDNDYHWRCDCGAGHFLTLTWDSDDLREPVEAAGYLAVEGQFWTTLRGRVRQALRVLRTGCSDTRVGVLLSNEKAGEIIAALEKYRADMDALAQKYVAALAGKAGERDDALVHDLIAEHGEPSPEAYEWADDVLGGTS